MDIQPLEGPVYVGYWEIGGGYGLCISVESKPNWFHRTMTKLFFGILWKDGSPIGAK